MEKIRYEVDPQNRLVIKKTGLPGFRRVLDGYFKTAGRNALTYHVKVPVPEDIKNHDLTFTLDKWKRQTFGDQLTIQGDIIDAKRNALSFAVTTRTKEDTRSVYILKLEGSWQADEDNRLTFRVKRENGQYDTLIFEGAWEAGKDYQITYRYKKERLVRKRKKIHTLTLQGHWQIRDKYRISYLIDRDSDSALNFKSSAGVFKDNYIRYELGIGGLRRVGSVRRAITLFGGWKVKKGMGLVFEVEYGARRIQDIVFGVDARLTDKDTVLFRLKNELNREIGAEIELAHDIFKGDGRIFLRLLKSEGKHSILAGAGFNW
jgi:hypothetical protein